MVNGKRETQKISFLGLLIKKRHLTFLLRQIKSYQTTSLQSPFIRTNIPAWAKTHT